MLPPSSYHNPYRQSASGIVFRDVLSLALILMIACVFILILHINPEGTQDNDEAPAAGLLMAELVWPAEYNCDVDLWVQSPHERAIGYSRAKSTVAALLRDDLGHNNYDTGPHAVNQEIVWAWRIPPGRWVFNAHLYRAVHDECTTMPVQLTITLKTDHPVKRKTQLFKGTVTLPVLGSERTFSIFELNDAMALIPGTQINNVNIPIRSASGP